MTTTITSAGTDRHGAEFAPNHHAIETAAIHAGITPDPETGAILTPIYQSTTFVQPAVGQSTGYTYSRTGNPTVAALQRQLGALDGVEPAVCCSTGMSALTALFLGTLRQGDHVLVSDVVYGGTVRVLRQVLADFGVRTTFVDTSNLDAVAAALAEDTRLVLIETPANPTLKLTDIHAIAGLAHAAGALLAVDNTFLTPVLQRTFELGADIVVYSTTKFIEGHNTTVGGALLARDPELRERFAFIQNATGITQSPFEAWLTLRGLKTLPLRIRQHSNHALEVARWLECDPRIEQVWYPGLDSFPQFELAQRQQESGGGLIAFEPVGGFAAARRFVERVEVVRLAENLGAVESLVTHPASMTHGDVPEEQRLRTGITDGLIRLSVGLESPRDLIADLNQALGR